MKGFLLSLFLSVSIVGTSQLTTGSAWASTSISYRISDFTLGLEEGIRFTEADLNQTYSDVSVKYKINKYLRTGFTWRNSQKNGFLDATRIDNRFSGDIIGRYKKKKILTFIRLRYQSKYKDWFVSKNGHLPDSYVRTKLGFRYSLRKKMSLETAAESYYAFKNEANYINRYRIYFGVSYQIKKQHAVELNYIYQSETQEANPEAGHILSLSYSYDLNAALKKRRKRKKKLDKKRKEGKEPAN
ncbi:DUF2490 domain-containing protein [Flavobacteriales bacterium]|nr:DUF2490 domain-containing protein [Flavobacteriales bacterium]